MNKDINSIHLNNSNNFHYTNSYFHKKKLSYSNPYGNKFSLNITSENQAKYSKLGSSLPIHAFKSKIINSNLANKTIESTFSPRLKIKKVQPIFNNNSIYYSKHKNKTTFINDYLNSEIKLYPYKNNRNDKKAYLSNYNLNSELKFNKDKENQNYNHIKSKSSFINSYLNTEIKKQTIKERQIINHRIRNNPNIKNLFDYKNNNSYNYRNQNKFENSKNNESLENEKNYFYFETCCNSKDGNNNFFEKKNTKVFRCIPRKLSASISSKKLFIKNKKKDIISATKFSNKKINSEIEIPKVINPNEFRIINQIGYGSFGQIYKTIWNRNNEKYAMKIMHTKIRDNILYIQDKVHLFMDFVEKTKCEGLIKIFGDRYIKNRDEYYYYEIMQLAERDWEQEIIKRREKLRYYSERELFTILSQLVKTLSLLQQNHITHRDIKIQNILLLDGKFKICDFGEARKLTQKGVIVQPVRGSELYMSPIQFFGLNQKLKHVQHNTYKSDVFSLGMCILFAATLSDDCLYDIRELTDMNHIRKILEYYLSNRYSKVFIRLLLYFLEVKEKNRPDFIQMEKIISKIKINE